MRIWSVWLLFVLVACAPLQPPVPGPLPDDPPGECGPACANLELLKCPGWQGSPGPDDEFGTIDDVPCEQACEETLAADDSVELHPGCIAEAESCDGAEMCFEIPGTAREVAL